MMRTKTRKKEEELEERLKDIQDFLKRWLEFHKTYKRAYRGEEITREAEAEFLKMKSYLARRHAMLVERLGKDYINVAPIRPLLSQTVTLRHMSRIRPDHYERIERMWHETYIHLNESIGHLRYLLDQGE